MALAARRCGMSYGQYVAARYYPVIIVEELPDGGKIERRAAMPEGIGDGTAAEPMVRKAEPVRKKKPERLCVVCGHPLRGNYRKYCSEECREGVEKVRKNETAKKWYKPVERMDKPCAICGRVMAGTTENRKYCGALCRKLGAASVQKAWRMANPEAKPERYCEICGVRLEGLARKYCPNCSGAAHKERNKAAWARAKGKAEEIALDAE